MEKMMNFVNGEYVEPHSGVHMDNYDPSTGKVYCQVPDSNEVDVVFAIQAAKKAYESWKKTTVNERATILNKVADLLEARTDEFAEAESRDVGKPYWLAKNIEIPRAISNFRFFASKILTMESSSSVMDDHAINYTLRQSVGVCGLIAPWNLPFYLMTWKLAPCLAMGNTAVCKPSEVTPMTAMMLGEVLNEAGLPKGVCNIIVGRGQTAGAALVSHPAVPVISFTGGTSTGEVVQQLAAPHVKKVSLELGGKNANIIFDDADIKKAVATTLRSSFQNSGQICLCGSRVLVQQKIYDEFMEEFRKQTKELIAGDRKDENTFIGPLVSKEHYEKVLSCIEQAKKEDGKVTVGGSVPENLPEDLKGGYYLQPTIIEDLTNCSDLWLNEIFGPVVTVMPFKYQADAVKWANTSSYGLSCSIWTQNLRRAHTVAQQIEAGTVWVNCWMKRDLRVPFGGVKASGVGREGGDHSLNIYSEMKNVCISLEK